MVNPKQSLTPFREVTNAERVRLAGIERRGMAGDLAWGMAEANVPKDFDDPVQRKLMEYGFHCVEEVVSLAVLDKRDQTNFVKDLGIAPELADRLLDQMKKTEEGKEELSDWDDFAAREYAVGFEFKDDEEPPPLPGDYALGSVLLAEAAIAPTSVNLIDTSMPLIRDQQNRGTCTAFAGVACLEYFLNRFKKQLGIDLSEQFLYCRMVEQTGRRTLWASFPLMKEGVCLESSWPYNGSPIPGNDSQGPPPASALKGAPAYRCKKVKQLFARSVDEIKDALQQSRPVAIGIPVYRSWMDSSVVRKHGNITMPLPGEAPEDIGHAITLVGYQDDPDYPDGGYFIVRNSWDHRWGTQSPYGSGYGTIPYRYIARYNWDAWCIVN